MFEPETEEGNIEYKRHLLNIDSDKRWRIIKQMRWRLDEGNGEAIYVIGVEDNGDVIESVERRAGLRWNFRNLMQE